MAGRTKQAVAGSLLAEAVIQAEKNIIERIASGYARWPATPKSLLTGLALATGKVLRAQSISKDELILIELFIVTDSEYSPNNLLPFTKEQMKEAFEAN